MPIPTPVPPHTLMRILELFDYMLVDEDENNWCMSKMDQEPPIIIPKRGDVVTTDVMSNVLDRARMNNATYFALLRETQEEEE